MLKYILSLGLSFVLSFGMTQNYVDLAKFTHTGVPSTTVDVPGSENFETSLSQTKLLTSIPIKITDSLAFLTGIDYENHNLQLKRAWKSSSMHVSTLKLGINVKHNSKLSGTYLLLPKLASDYKDFSNSFQIGAIALFKYQLNPQTKFIFGNYINKEIYGILNVPILGLYHKSKNGKLESDIKFPIVGYGDYKVHKNVRLGADFLMIVRTFDLTQDLSSGFYSQLASNEVGGYLQFDLFKESLIIKAKAVYAMFDYALYQDGSTTPFGMLGWYPGDDRTRFNGEIASALGFKISAIYRFQLGE